jgi:ligand-binding SRPBCC domain-containing protein
MKTYQYKTEQEIDIPILKAWEFFSSPVNLPLITPPELDLKLATIPVAPEIFEGMIIDYRLRPLFGFPVRWKTLISKVNKPYCFVDKQLTGPYRLWEHTHHFQESSNGVIIKDEVRYKLPFGIVGLAVHAAVVRNRIKKIFDYRREMLQKKFQ